MQKNWSKKYLFFLFIWPFSTWLSFWEQPGNIEPERMNTDKGEIWGSRALHKYSVCSNELKPNQQIFTHNAHPPGLNSINYLHVFVSPWRRSTLSPPRWMPVWRSRWGEAVSHRPAVGWGAMWLRMCCRVSWEPASKPRHLPVSVQRESTVVSAAGQEVQPQHLQVGVLDPAVIEQNYKLCTLSSLLLPWKGQAELTVPLCPKSKKPISNHNNKHFF